MESLRVLQIIEDFSLKILKNKGRLPLKHEVDSMLRKTNEYLPFSNPMVPLKKALSNADFITDTLKYILKDSNSVTELITSLSSKADRVETTSTQELLNLQLKASRLLELYKEDYTKMIYSEKPGLPEPDSGNIYYGKEGIQINPSSQNAVDFNYSIVTYSSNNNVVKLKTLNTDPLHIIANGATNDGKGITLNINIKDNNKFISTLSIQCSPITVELVVNGKSLATRDIIDSETFIIGKKVVSLSLHIYSNAPQVDINIISLFLFNSVYEMDSGYDIGTYISPTLKLGADNGRLIFDPSTYIPEEAGIVWYYSTDYVEGSTYTVWNLIEKDSNDVMHIWWNTQQVLPSLDSISDSINNTRTIIEIPDNYYKGTEITSGNSCILFIADKYNSLYKFTTYIKVTEEGYFLEIENPKLGDDYLISNLSMTSDSFTFNENISTKELIGEEIPEGTHLVEIELGSTGLFDNIEDYTDVLSQIETELKVEFNIRGFFDTDHLGRSVTHFISKLYEEDSLLINYTRQRDRIFLYSIRSNHNIGVENWNNSPESYDIILNNSIYTEGATFIAHFEEHIYAGTGESWLYNIYHAPLGTIQMYDSFFTCYGPTGLGSTADDGSCVGTTSDTIFVEDTTIIDHNGAYYYKGLDPVMSFDLLTPRTGIGSTAAFSGSAYSISETWSYDSTGATFTLSRLPAGSTAIVLDDTGTTHAATYVVPGGSGEDGGTINVTSPVASATYTAIYSGLVSIREQNEETVTLQNLPPFPFGASPVLHEQVVNTTTPLGALGATGELFYEDITLNYNINSIQSLEYEGELGPTFLNIGGASGVEGATGGYLLNVYNKSITVNTILLSANQQLTINYYTYELSEGYPFSLIYDYFNSVPYYFTYLYEVFDYASPSTIYGNTGMLNYFYDISYYVPGSTLDSINLKAVMKGTEKETPIIRRIRLKDE